MQPCYFVICTALSSLLSLGGAQESRQPPVWEKVESAPRWVEKVPERSGYLRFVIVGRSNGAPIARGQAMQPSQRSVMLELQRRLERTLGKKLVAKIAAPAHTHKSLLRRAESFRVLTRRPVPGNTLAEAWTLWEVAVDKLLDALPKEERRMVAGALGALELDQRAWRMQPARNWIRKSAIQVMESAPPQFGLDCLVEMPTPGWKLEVDSVKDADPTGRVQVFVTGQAPTGIVPQVITNERLYINLRYCNVGPLLVDVFYRRGKTAKYARRGVVLLHAIAK